MAWSTRVGGPQVHRLLTWDSVANRVPSIRQKRGITGEAEVKRRIKTLVGGSTLLPQKGMAAEATPMSPPTGPGKKRARLCTETSILSRRVRTGDCSNDHIRLIFKAHSTWAHYSTITRWKSRSQPEKLENERKYFPCIFPKFNSALHLSTLLHRPENLLYLENNKESWYFLKRGMNKTKAL